MGQSYRIQTELGINKTINVQLDQEFEFLEILSLKIQQSDIYTRSCADYGVVVGRITANGGFGLPNARVSIFIPIESIDESNPIIQSIYPYKSSSDKNDDGYRYNLLPYEKSYSKHAATGTLPSRNDVLTASTVVEIYDKYYRFTAKTNESGDYMIMGVPLGEQTLVMDVDLSDIGEFSLTPQDLIRMGIATEAQVAGNQFRTSTDLNSLPQIVSLSVNTEISPLWGDPDLCQIAINRVDFDLRDSANIDIQPTSTFMGSVYSTADGFRVRKNCKPRDNMGNLCSLASGPGQILSIRQTIQQDADGNPILEQYQLEQAGNIIDGNGTWLTELPMNLDYLVTNQFGEKVLSNNPTIGIPTKAKYRFKIKWQQPAALTTQTRRPNYLVPNIKEYGWTNNTNDPNYSTSVNQKLESSYYFGLAWSGYTNGFTSTAKTNRLNEIIDCEDTFYEFKFNRVYTIAGLIDEYKKGAKGRFIGIKEIDDDDCSSSVNKFPVNDGFRNFDFLFFLFSILMTILQPVALILLFVAHILLWLYNLIFVFLCAVCRLPIIRRIGFCKRLKCDKRSFVLRLPMITYPECQACECAQESKTTPTVPEEETNPDNISTGFLSYLSSPLSYSGMLIDKFSADTVNSDLIATTISEAIAGRATFAFINNPTVYKMPRSKSVNFTISESEICITGNQYRIENNTQSSISISYYDCSGVLQSDPNLGSGQQITFCANLSYGPIEYSSGSLFDLGLCPLPTETQTIVLPGFATSKSLPLGERVNIFNQRKNFFTGKNKIKVTFAKDSNYGKSHYDNTLTVLSTTQYNTGDLLTFINLDSTTDKNFLYSADTINGLETGISGTSYNGAGATTINVSYATSQYINSTPISYTLPSGSTENNYKFPADIEYFQVVTALTVSQAVAIWNANDLQSFPNLFEENTYVDRWVKEVIGNRYLPDNSGDYKAIDYYSDFQNQYVLVLQRGVDPYSPKYINEYSLGNIFGTNESDSNWTFTAETRVNIPIQRLTNTSITIQPYNNQSDIFYQSYFFSPGIPGSTVSGGEFTGYTTTNTAYYGLLSSEITTTYGTSSSNEIISKSANGFYDNAQSSAYYDDSEDLSGAALMGCVDYDQTNSASSDQSYFGYTYYTNSIWSSPNNSITLSTSQLNVMRTDRLPTSDGLDGGSWTNNPSILQQNNNFAIYVINTDGEDITSTAFTTGADIVTPDLSGLTNAIKVLESFNCESMVGLKCYKGFGSNFEIDQNCVEKDGVQRGCYLFMRKPLTDLKKDINNFNEWAFRFRFFYGLCRGVLSQSFMNNWVNGSLYMFPIQVDTRYDSRNQPYSSFCKDLVHFNSETNNFYYRSSPYNTNSNKFIGIPSPADRSVNVRNLLFPTTIINLGMKDYFYQEITFDPSTRGYIMPNLDSTSYGDTSDLVNLFVISRITDETFLKQILSTLPLVGGDNSLNQLFSRNNPSLFNQARRIDGDLAQLLSINSEEGVIKFSPEYYETVPGSTTDPTTILGTASNPTIAVWFSSSTNDIQFKDFITPGRINFRPDDNANYYPYPYGIKSQVVPFYQWQLNNTTTIFGDQYNSWATNLNDIVQNKRYQSLDRTSQTIPNYFRPSTSSVNDLYARGYIFSVDANGVYSTVGATSDKFLVGAPFQFYFGTVKGESALDKFKTKYSIIE